MFMLAAPKDGLAQAREGFWFGLGAGYGSADATCDDCDSGDREGSGVAYIRSGYALNERLLVGAEATVWSKSFEIPDLGGDSRLNMYNVMAILTFYPQPSGGLFVKGGVGVAVLDLELDLDDATLDADLGTGLGLSIGAGYDIPVGRIAITPGVNFWYGQPGDLRLLGETIATNWKQNVVDFTVGITFP